MPVVGTRFNSRFTWANTDGSMPIKYVLFKSKRTDHDTTVTGSRDRGFGTKFVTLMSLALAHAVDMRFVQTIQLVFITPLLFQHALIQGHLLCILRVLFSPHPALYFPL